MVRSYAKQALVKIADHSLIPTLFQMLPGAPYQADISSILVHFKCEAVVNGMLVLLRNNDAKLREHAAYALGHLNDRTVVPALLDALKDEEEDVRKFSAFALGDLKDPRAVPELIAVVKHQDEFDEVRRAAALALSEIGTREARIAYRDWSRQEEN